jgi:hypothetical protein
MTDLETHVPTSIPAGRPARPVRRFVAAQVLLAVLFGTLWWSGLVAPRLGFVNGSGGVYHSDTGRTTVVLDLRNNSPWAVEIHRVAPADGRVTIDSVRVDGVDLANDGQRVAGGGEATVVIELTCGVTPGGNPFPSPAPPWAPIKLEVKVSTALGLERTRTTRTVYLPPACFD